MTDRQIFRLVFILTAEHEAKEEAVQVAVQAVADQTVSQAMTPEREYAELLRVGRMLGTPRSVLDAEWEKKRGKKPH